MKAYIYVRPLIGQINFPSGIRPTQMAARGFDVVVNGSEDPKQKEVTVVPVYTTIAEVGVLRECFEAKLEWAQLAAHERQALGGDKVFEEKIRDLIQQQLSQPAPEFCAGKEVALALRCDYFLHDEFNAASEKISADNALKCFSPIAIFATKEAAEAYRVSLSPNSAVKLITFTVVDDPKNLDALRTQEYRQSALTKISHCRKILGLN